MKKKLIGIAALLSGLVLVTVLILAALRGEQFKASHLQLALIFFTSAISFSGIYLLNTSHVNIKSSIKLAISVYGIALIAFAALVGFNILDFRTTYNWFISGGILFILFVQLQLLRWGKESNLFVKACAFAVLFANLFLIVYFIAKWTYSAISLWIDTAILISAIGFLSGFIANKKTI